jgi:hypothetical protein
LHKSKKGPPSPVLVPGPGWDVVPRERSFGSLRTIRDPKLLGAVVEEIIARLGSGSETEATQRTGVERSTLNRLRVTHRRPLRGKGRKHDRILQATALRLELAAKELGPEWLRKFLRALGADQRRMAAYHEWLDERTTRWERRRGAHWGCADGQPVLAGRGKRVVEQRHGFLRRTEQFLLRTLERECHSTYEEVLKFETWGYHRAGQDRTRLAWIRIIEPLLEVSESALVEVPFWALSTEDLRKFIEAGLKRERILIGTRGTDADRVESPCQQMPKRFRG